MYQNQRFVKVLNKTLNHNGFKYKRGRNVDTVPFNPTGNCLPGGLYFTKLEYLSMYLNFGIRIADVEIPPDAQVYAEPCGTKWKADKLIIKNIRWIDGLSEWDDEKFCQEQFALNIEAAIYIRANKEKWQLLAIKQDYRLIKDLRGPSFVVLKDAVTSCGFMLQYIDLFDKHNYVKKRNKWTRIAKFLYDQIMTLCKLAINYNGATLQFIPEEFQTFDICKTALSKNRTAYDYIKNWSRFTKKQALQLSLAFDC